MTKMCEKIRETYLSCQASENGWIAVEKLFIEEAAKYQALVDAAVDYVVDHHNENQGYEKLYQAVQPFLPPPLLSEKLDKLIDEYQRGIAIELDAIRQLADEAREMEGKL